MRRYERAEGVVADCGDSRENRYSAHDTEETNGGGVLVHHAFDVQQL